MQIGGNNVRDLDENRAWYALAEATGWLGFAVGVFVGAVVFTILCNVGHG